jgi:CheY-like chemotaxis protein
MTLCLTGRLHSRVLAKSSRRDIFLVAPQTSKGPVSLASRAGQSPERLVLVVDDEPVVRTYMLRALGEAGFEVVVAGEEGEALALLGTGEAPTARVVVSDWTMPGMSGVQLAGILAERWPWLPVLLVSGQEPTGWAWPFLRKPFTPDQLVQAVGKLLPPEDGKGRLRLVET